ncbi:MAG: tRNA-dihydrouridine synthase family protein [Bdellovibrionales bacterium]|nr:tRNA-dihydrouridine synthase family protein [Bdellovibrionales bacterium]NQZ18874.1 tRNA-dihydrouridine synthase family protein [Bdellovibrionales bacterium]
MRTLLAPMEGVVDPIVRELYTAVGGIDYCVTEFVRITDNIYPNKVFLKYCPELETQSRTTSGTPVFVQLLGGKPEPMGENAHKVSEMGAYGIDLNFGCPAKTVNRHDGGAALLKNPKRVFKITEAVRKAVPKEKPVTVKVRLGYSDKSLTKEIAQAAEAGGGHWLTVHARTKEEGYRPPAHWEYIAEMKDQVSIPVIANGDIWSVEDFKRCIEVSGCKDVMMGRGLVAKPDLALQIKEGVEQKTFFQWERFLKSFIEKSFMTRGDRYAVQRTKQLTKLMGRTYEESFLLFESIKRRKTYEEIIQGVDEFFRKTEILPSEEISS